MDLRRLRPGEWVLTAAAIVLVVSLFLSWYALPTGRRATAWEAFSVVDVVLSTRPRCPRSRASPRPGPGSWQWS